MTLDEQIQWVSQSCTRLRATLPAKVAAGAVSQERASYLLAVAGETLQTLTQLRGLVLRGAPKPRNPS